MKERRKIRVQTITPKYFGSPNQRIAFLKKIWWHLPVFVRPFIYFFYRFIIQLGILDGKEGWIFHFLQAFWFRLVVDIKIMELKNNEKN